MPSSSSSNNFSSRLGFIAAAAGSAIGLGNIWKFPKEVATHGGGSFLMVYLFFVLLLGYPLVLAELAFGRQVRTGLKDAYKQAGYPQWQWLGGLATGIAFGCYVLYNIVTGWVLGYVWKMVSGTLLLQGEGANYATTFEAFKTDMGANMVCTFVVILMVALINRAGVSNGIERASKVLMPLFFAMLIGLILYACTLPNASKGISYYLLPRWEALTKEAISVALSQAFMSLSVGMGVLITYGSYVDKKDNLTYSAAVVALSDTFVAFAAGLFLFAFLGDVPTDEGPGLAFIVLPAIFATLGPVAGMLAGTLFFCLLLLAALTSAISLLEVVTNYVATRWALGRTHSIALIAFVAYLSSLPLILALTGEGVLADYNLFDRASTLVFDFGIALGGFCFSLFVARYWQVEALLQAVGLDRKTQPWLCAYLTVVLRYLCPFLVGVVLLLEVYGLLGWIIA